MAFTLSLLFCPFPSSAQMHFSSYHPVIPAILINVSPSSICRPVPLCHPERSEGSPRWNFLLIAPKAKMQHTNDHPGASLPVVSSVTGHSPTNLHIQSQR